MAKDRVDAGRGKRSAGVKGSNAARAGSKSAVRPSSSNKTFVWLLGGIVLVAGLLIVYQMRRPTSLGIVTIDPGTPLPEAQGYLLGNPDAPVKVIEFADFECPACGSYATLTEPDVRARLVETGIVSIRYLDYPLDVHQNTWDASLAAACANEQGKFWPMHDQIFATQDKWNTESTNRPRSILREDARAVGVDLGKWDECYDSERYKLNIAANQAEGAKRMIQSTPTFIIGSKMIPGALGFDTFKAYVDSALAALPPSDTARPE